MRTVVNLVPRSERKISLPLRCFTSCWSLRGEICRQRLARFSANRHQTGLVSLAGHAHDTLFEIEILQSCICQLGDTQPTCVKQLDHRAIAQSVSSFYVDRFQELLHLQFIECFREITLNSR